MVGSQEFESVVDNGGVSDANMLMGAGRGTTLYRVREYNPYAVAGGMLGTTYLNNVLTLDSGYYHTVAVRGITSSEDLSVTTYTCPKCETEHTGLTSDIHTIADNGDGTVTLTCTADLLDPTDSSVVGQCDYNAVLPAENIKTTVTIHDSQGRDVVTWGGNDSAQLGDQKTTGRGLVDYVTGLGTAADSDGKDVDLLKVYAGANNSGAIFAEDLSDIDPDTNKLHILGKNTEYQQGDDDNTDPALTGDRALQGNSYNTRTVNNSADFGGYFNRPYDLSLSELTTVAVQKEGSVWAWGSDAAYRRGDFGGQDITVGTPVQVGLEDYYDLLINKAELYAYQISGVANGNEAQDAADRNYEAYDRAMIADYGRSASFAPAAQEKPLSREITLRPYQDLEIDLKSMFVRQDWGFNLRVDYEDVAAVWECMKVRSLNTDLITVIPFAFEHADGTAVADESAVTGDYESFVDGNGVACYPTKVRLSVNRDQSSQGRASILFQDMERGAQSLLLISVIPAVVDDTTDHSADLADIDEDLTNAKAITVPQVVVSGAMNGGSNTVYALTAYGELYAWGHNGFGQAAYPLNGTESKAILGTTSLDGIYLAKDANGNDMTDVLQISATNGSVVVVRKDGTVWQSGARASSRYINTAFTRVNLSGVIKVGVGTAYTGSQDGNTPVTRSCNSNSSIWSNKWTYYYALTSGGQVYVWYSGSFLCPGWTYHSSHHYEVSSGPSLVSDQFGNGLRYIVDLSVGEGGVMALGADGSVYSGSIGTGSLSGITPPTQLTTIGIATPLWR